MKSHSETYKQAGVDIEAGYKAVELMKGSIARTMTKGVLSGIGGFGGLYQPDFSNMPNPVLVSGTDGVGTKLKIAFIMDKHDTVGIDCVAMCVNDIICSGAMPLFFLDYIALGKNVPEKVAAIVSGVAEGCVQAGCALIGGETAEMPGFYTVDEYDIAGFAVGAVDKSKILDNTKVKPGDAIIALPSSGLHSNGFSLTRRVFNVEAPGKLNKYYDELGSTLGEVLLTPTKIYVAAVRALLQQVDVKSISNITGGGFYENIPRSLPVNMAAKVEKAAIRTPAVFKFLQQAGQVPERDMFNTYNMGVGMTIIIDAALADKAVKLLNESGEAAYVLGEVIAQDGGGVIIC